MNNNRRVASLVLGAIGLLPVVWIVASDGIQASLWRVVLHVVLLLVASASPIQVGNAQVSLIFPVLFPVIVTQHPGTAAIIAALGSIQKVQITSGIDLVVANRALVGIPTLLASALYHAISADAGFWSLQSLISMVISAYLYTLANNLLAIGLVRIQKMKQELPVFSLMVRNLRSFTFSLLLGLLLTFVYTLSEALFAVLVVLFYFNRETLYANIVNQNLYAQIINAMVKVIENVDPYTKGHSERVAAYGQAIGRKLHLKPLELNRLHLIAMLHDLGKQSIPVEILRKTGRLTEDEFALIKQHPEKGADMLRGISLFSQNHLRAISEHHERWDGRGYPKGLAGESIDSWARIISVADAFDAMTTDRPYRPAITPEAALCELKRGAGTQFDPRMVSLFASVYDSRAVQEALQSRLELVALKSLDESDTSGDIRSAMQS